MALSEKKRKNNQKMNWNPDQRMSLNPQILTHPPLNAHLIIQGPNPLLPPTALFMTNEHPSRPRSDNSLPVHSSPINTRRVATTQSTSLKRVYTTHPLNKTPKNPRARIELSFTGTHFNHSKEATRFSFLTYTLPHIPPPIFPTHKTHPIFGRIKFKKKKKAKPSIFYHHNGLLPPLPQPTTQRQPTLQFHHRQLRRV